MRFSKKFTIRNGFETGAFAKGIWSPSRSEWRNVVEDYLYISRKRTDKKLSVLKLQLSILMDIVDNFKAIDTYKEQSKVLEADKTAGKITTEEYDKTYKHFELEIFNHELIIKALKEIMDGVVWRYFKYNRAILYMLADKEPIQTINVDAGLINTLREFSEKFLEPETYAILNDITNFLRVGDVTKIDKDDNIEIIEVKSSGGRGGRRIQRQKQRMAELVEFFNTGLREFDNIKVRIIDSSIRQKNHLSILLDAIRRAKYRGYESVLIGNYIILEIMDYGLIEKIEEAFAYFEKKHKSVREKWEKDNDIVLSSFFLEKLEFSKNYAPFSIFPFDVEICADMILGKLNIMAHFNYSELMRIFQKGGWEITDSIFFKSEREIEQYSGSLENLSFFTLSKSKFSIEIPPSYIGRMQFELIKPSVILQELEEGAAEVKNGEADRIMYNYLDEQNIWI